MATLTTQVIKRAGLGPVYTAVNSADRFTPGTNVFLHVKNANASPTNVTVTTTGKVDGDIAGSNVVVSVPATTGDRMIGPFPADQFLAADGSGLCDVAYSVTASVTAAVIQLQMP